MDSPNSYPCRFALRSVVVFSFLLLASGASQPVVAQALCENCWYNSPIATSGGPYVGMTGQSVSMNGQDSWSQYGEITDYYWDFGDGTSGTGPTPSHQYSTDGVYSVSLWVCDSEGNWGYSQSFVTVNSASLPVRINFDELSNNIVVADQYYSPYGVRFYSSNVFYPVRTYQNCGFCSTTSPPNFITTKPDDYGQTTIEFTQAVSNLTFYVVGVDTFSGLFGRLDVYRNGAYSQTYNLTGVFNNTVGFTLGATTNITKIVI